jgi:hypothetical protein
MAPRKKGRPRRFKQWEHLSEKEYAKKANTEQRRLWRANNPEKSKAAIEAEAERIKSSPENKVKYLISQAKGRAKRDGIEFSISLIHVYIPYHCRLQGIEICYCNDGLKDNSPSLDRIDPTKGYVPGNVWIISQRANRIKSDAALAELKNLVANLEKEMIARGIA